MRKLLLCATAVVFVTTAATAQTCNPPPNAVAMFKTWVKGSCGLTPTTEQSVEFLCDLRWPNIWLVRAALNYCAING